MTTVVIIGSEIGAVGVCQSLLITEINHVHHISLPGTASTLVSGCRDRGQHQGAEIKGSRVYGDFGLQDFGLRSREMGYEEVSSRQ